ncbi:MAG TPA: dihydrofolate reductase family protein [Chitinophaga sp.]
MRKLSVFMHISLDGFTAGPNGEMDWINVDDEIFDYAGQRTDESDTALYGRVTYEMMEGYWPTAADQPGASKHDIQHSKWYKSVDKIVLSKTLRGQQPDKTRIISDNIGAEIKALKKALGKEIIVFGSPSAVHTLTGEGLVDDFWLFVNPVILGKGIPLFKDLKDRVPLKLVESKTFSSGVVCLHYEKVT